MKVYCFSQIVQMNLWVYFIVLKKNNLLFLQKNNTLTLGLLVGILAIFFTSCNPSKLLREDELLVTESSIKFVDKKTINNRNETKYALESLAKPQPNTGIFNIKVWTYLKLRDHKKEKGIKSWIKRKIGEPPALYNPVTIKRNRLQIRKYLKDNGYFESDLEIDTLVGDREVSIKYTIDTRGQYKIRDIYLPEDSSDIASIIYRASKRSLLKPGDPYQEVTLGLERTRISEVANNRGFLEFDPNVIFYFVDTIPNTLKLDIYVRVDDTQKEVKQKTFRVGKTYVHPNFDLSNKDGLSFGDTIKYKPDFVVIQNEPVVRPSVMDRLILQKEGDVYNKRLQDVSVSHLLDLGVFKYVNLKYQAVTDSASTDQVLDRLIYLTPGIAKTLTTDLELNNRTGSFFGTTAGINFNHKNVFDRGLTWNNRLSGGVETQRGVTGPLINTVDISLETTLSLPRLLFFPDKKRTSGVFVSRTNLALSNNYQRRTGLYTINATAFSFGYNWKPNRRIQHVFNPLTIRQVNVLSSSEEFQELLAENSRLRGSFTDVFIGGLEYTYIHTTQAADPKDDYWYYRAKAKLAGNAFSLFINKGANGAPGEIFGQPFSQFVSLEQDIRYYLPFLRTGKLAFRFVPAIGVAYGNSELLPYVEQYFVGGSNSIRAFQIRGVGPGFSFNENSETTTIGQQFIDQTGDIKLEFSAEYRFPIFGFFKGALFADAGNVWLLNIDPDTRAGHFEFNRFYKEIAIGTGFGLRVDVEFFVIRLDLAAPIREPVTEREFAWTFENLNIISNFDSFVWNIAIGYPF